jgi:preprotein translocase SecE subunit
MAKQVLASDAKPNLYQRVKGFLLEVKVELDKVTWPTLDDLKVSTKVTMFMLCIMAAVIFVYDQAFQVVVLLLLSLAA